MQDHSPTNQDHPQPQQQNQTTSPSTPPQEGVVPHNPADLTLHLTIRDTRRMLVDEVVKGITSYNSRGVFDVLAFHENFISLIADYITIHKLNGENQTMQIDNGIIYVTKNEVKCYINLIASPDTKPGAQQQEKTQTQAE